MVPGNRGRKRCCGCPDRKEKSVWQAADELPILRGPGTVHYNEYATGRPHVEGKDKDRFRSKYLDIPNAPLYPFGYGLSYTTFAVSDVVLDQNEMDKNGRIAAKVTVKNTGDAAGCEVVQLYIRDDYSDVVRPVKELKGFRKVELAPGEEQEVTFYITEEDLRYYRLDGTDFTATGLGYTQSMQHLVLPIPTQALSGNSLLVQNPTYEISNH